MTALGTHSAWRPDYAAIARRRIADARTRAGQNHSEFATRLTQQLGRPVAAGHVQAWESTTTPPGDVLLAVSALAPTPATQIGIRSHKFIAAQIPPAAIGDLVAAVDAAPTEEFGKLGGWSAPMARPGCTMKIFAFGTVIIHLAEEVDAADITSIALWRYDTYPADLQWASETLSSLTDAPVTGSYILSLYWIYTAPWVGASLETAVRLICSPRVLIDPDAPDGAAAQVAGERIEAQLLAAGYPDVKMASFGIPGVSTGFASWSGVAYHPHDPARALSEPRVVTFEIALQAIWSYTHAINESPGSIDPKFGHRFLRRVRPMLFTPRPQETGSEYSMREAITTTSGLIEQLELAMDALQEI
ncbi:hypothetical protein [Nocardia sp. NPDC060249]|uniref:hypothetical protein n=1 Tax=Nocardia sp. NPDC060249 TaxID=3347082 RepID=UPI00364CBD5C